MKKVGLRTLLAIGAASFAAGMIVWSVRLTPDISDSQMYLPLILTGFGAGWEIGPVSTLINSQTPPNCSANRWSFTSSSARSAAVGESPFSPSW
jgi:MFS family permease